MTNRSERSDRVGTAALVVGAAVIGAALVLVATRHGMLLDADSAGYLRTARALRADLSTYFSSSGPADLADTSVHPPFYSLLLSLVGSNASELTAARVVNTASAAVTFGATALLVRRHASALAAAGVVAALTIVRGLIVQVHGFIMSDGVFLATTLTAIVVFDSARRAPTERSRRLLLGATALLAAAAFSTRLVGLGLVVTLAIAAFDRRPAATRRWMASAVILVVGVAPTLAWILTRAGSGAGWGGWLHWYGLPIDEVLAPIRALTNAVLPGAVIESPWRWIADAVSAAVCTLAALWAVRRVRAAVRTPDRGRLDLVPTLCLFVGAHVAMLFAARAFFDLFIGIDGRHLAPVFVAALIVTGISVGGARLPTTVPGVAFAAALALVVASGAVITMRALSDPTENWFNLGTAEAGSTVLAEARRLPPETTVFSNDPAVLFLLADIDAQPLTLERDPASGEPNPAFDEELAELRETLLRRDGVVVLVHPTIMWSLSSDQLVAVGLAVEFESADGAILRCTDACR